MINIRKFIARLMAAALLAASVFLCSVETEAFAFASEGSLGAQTARRGTSVSPEVRRRVRQAVAAVGLIFVRENNAGSRRMRPRGSAVLVRSDGIIVTNHHVILDDRTRKLYPEMFFGLADNGATAISNAKLYGIKPVVINREKDLALLRIESDAEGNPLPESLVFPTIEIGDSNSIGLLDDLIIIGFPEKGGSTVTLSQGTVEGQNLLEGWIKTDARVIHGNSGGAAVDSEGKLIGIPTKVVADSQPIDSDGDGFPDAVRQYGAVGFLRPSHLVAAMLAQLKPAASEISRELSAPMLMPSTPPSVKVSGIIKAAVTGKLIAGARVGLVQLGSKTVTEFNLLTWGGTNADGKFTLNKPVPPGRYTLRASAIGYEAFMGDVEVKTEEDSIIIELQPARKK